MCRCENACFIFPFDVRAVICKRETRKHTDSRSCLKPVSRSTEFCVIHLTCCQEQTIAEISCLCFEREFQGVHSFPMRGPFCFVLAVVLLQANFLECLSLPEWSIWSRTYLNSGIRLASDYKHGKKTPQKKFGLSIENLTSGNVKPGPRSLQQFLYWVTALDAIQCVLLNDYRSNFLILSGSSKSSPSVYSKILGFAGLRPRLLFAIGALVRALQLCTPFRRIIDPSIGVGAGINLCAIMAGSRWVKPMVLGFSLTKWAWTWLGARQVDKAYVPITLSIREWEELKHKPKKEVTD